jgi:hypothetical protein
MVQNGDELANFSFRGQVPGCEHDVGRSREGVAIGISGSNGLRLAPGAEYGRSNLIVTDLPLLKRSHKRRTDKVCQIV